MSIRADDKWPARATVPELHESDVHVWRIDLKALHADVTDLIHVLSPDERERARRLHFDRDRNNFIASHYALRSILAGYLEDASPTSIAFDFGPHGKPTLRSNGHGIEFNLSHSHEISLCGLTRRHELGIDVEHTGRNLEIEPLAERFFAPAEAEQILACPDHTRRAAFFSCWTRKEAFLKARGDGITVNLDSFEVSCMPGQPARLLRCQQDSQAPAYWGMDSFVPESNYIGALAVHRSEFRTERFTFVPGGPRVKA